MTAREPSALTRAEAISLAQQHKAHEGARLQALFAAIGALPAGALVLGSDVSPGAPLFCSALLVLFASYMFWGYTDAVYQADSLQVLTEEERVGVARLGYQYQAACFAYGIAAVAMTFCGFGAIYSRIRTPITVDHGFYALVPLSIAVALHVLAASSSRNQMIEDVRSAALRAAQRAVDASKS